MCSSFVLGAKVCVLNAASDDCRSSPPCLPPGRRVHEAILQYGMPDLFRPSWPRSYWEWQCDAPAGFDARAMGAEDSAACAGYLVVQRVAAAALKGI